MPREGVSFDTGDVDAAPEPPETEERASLAPLAPELTARAFRIGGLPAVGFWTAAPEPLAGDGGGSSSGTSTTAEQAGQRIRFPAAVSGTFNVLLH